MNALLEGFKALGPARLVAMAGVAAAMLGMLAFLALRGGGNEKLSLLYADLDMREAAQINDQLDRAHITHEAGLDGRISVPASEVARARLLLAKEGLPSGGSIGYEIFDRGDSLTASQFQQAIAQTRAMEGELARSIRTIVGVKAARVHLVLPKREPFARDRQDAQASVVLTMAGAARMDREGVQSVLNLLSAAVPGLRPQNIGVIDSRGNLLARAGEVTGPAAAATGAAELRAASEQRVAHAVEEMLERSLGPGRVRVEASIDLDFDQVRETQEKFDPDGKVERSVQNTTSTSKTTEAAATVTVANNLPNADAGTNPAGTQEQKSEETTNFEIGKTVRTVTRDQPLLRRMSLAVLVDQVAVRNPDGSTEWKDRSADELARIGALARSAAGFNEKRGDTVEVVSLRFAVPDAEGGEAAKPNFLGMSFDKSDILRLGQSGLMGMVAILALLLVLRPMALKLTATPDAALAGPGGMAAAGGGALALAGPPGSTALALAGPGGALVPASGGALAGGGAGPAGLLADESMVQLGQVDGALRASSIRRLGELVNQHPTESLAILRGWMVKEPG